MKVMSYKSVSLHKLNTESTVLKTSSSQLAVGAISFGHELDDEKTEQENSLSRSKSSLTYVNYNISEENIKHNSAVFALNDVIAVIKADVKESYDKISQLRNKEAKRDKQIQELKSEGTSLEQTIESDKKILERQRAKNQTLSRSITKDAEEASEERSKQLRQQLEQIQKAHTQEMEDVIESSKTSPKKNSISFKGYWSRVEALRKPGFFGGVGWFFGGEDEAKELVATNMRNEINALKKEVAVKDVELSQTRRTLSDLEISHASIQSSKNSEIIALKDTLSNNNATISNIESTIRTKDIIISEQKAANKKLSGILNQQKQLIKDAQDEYNVLEEQRNKKNRDYERNLQKDLKNQRAQMQAIHETEIDKLKKSIEASLSNPVTQMTSVPKANGFCIIPEYQEQQRMIINHFGTPVALEKYGKPANVPNGILILGPASCDKLAFVKATAGQFECELVEIPNKFNDGINMKNLRAASTQAKELFEYNGVRTILYIDKFDEFAPQNASALTGLLKGFMDKASKEYHCTVFAATEYPEKIDKILLRDGRFDAKITF